MVILHNTFANAVVNLPANKKFVDVLSDSESAHHPLHIKPEQHDVAVTDRVVAAFGAHLSGLLGALFAAQ